MAPKLDGAKARRWEHAHEGEAAFWLELPEEEFVKQGEGYARLAEQIQRHYRTHVDSQGPFRVLQIGCAAEDAVFYFKEGELYAVDPLADFYKQNFSRARNPRVDYRNAMGEDIPHPDSFFNIVICQNVLDHCADYHVVMQEILRVLGEPNLLFFGTDVYPEEAAVKRWEADRRGEIYDINHPHTFTSETFDQMLAEHHLNIVQRWDRLESGKGDESWRYCLFARR